MPNFELMQDFIGVLVTCKKEVDPINIEGARVVTPGHYLPLTTLKFKFSVAQGHLTR